MKLYIKKEQLNMKLKNNGQVLLNILRLGKINLTNSVHGHHQHITKRELQLEIKKQEQKKIDDEIKEQKKWEKKIQDRQQQDEEFKKEQMKKKPICLSKPHSSIQKIPNEDMAKELHLKQDAIKSREMELKQYAQINKCNTVSKENENRILQCSSKSAWDDQIQKKLLARQKEQEKLLTKQQQFHEELIKERLEEEKNHQNRQNLMSQIKNDLVDKVAELQVSSVCYEELKKKEDAYINFQKKFENIKQERIIQEEHILENRMRTKLTKQYQTELKHKSKKMLQYMQEDSKFLINLIDLISISNIGIVVDEKIKKIQEILKQYENKESHKLHFMGFLFEEEARNMWNSQQEHWEKEYEIRKTEIDCLLKDIAVQLDDKIKKCLDEQRILIEERENILKIINDGNNDLKKMEIESKQFHKLYPNFYNQIQKCNGENQNGSGIELIDNEQLNLGITQLNLLNDKPTDYRRKRAIW
ncbi:trichoplein keratin filament-binding protein-like isoform X2 [Daktulosphaira vitifoliae]|uniref:trichoplein keratin filament-binding protein-like isoform X2 n=1 Tax=Daktulosphaira vitifoliae TaxID=58002 RepID=UPI0021AA96B7|nr:trichoplein keratin filament-binding protein-like isoform X2 [Daktulosphaira vitifoliae]